MMTTPACSMVLEQFPWHPAGCAEFLIKGLRIQEAVFSFTLS
jgi:hypothetical protein